MENLSSSAFPAPPQPMGRRPPSRRRRLANLLQRVAELTHAPPETAEIIAIAAAVPSCQRMQEEQGDHIFVWLENSLPPEVMLPIDHARQLAPHIERTTDLAGPMLSEELVALASSSERRSRGVYYTPSEVARFLVRRADCNLRRVFHLERGIFDDATWRQVALRTGVVIPTQLAPDEPFVRILDPAFGSGAFLVALLHEARAQGATDEALAALLARAHGWECLLPSLVGAALQLGHALLTLGFDFTRPVRLPWQQRDALAPPESETAGPTFTVILGNPPYASLSQARYGWIEAMISGPGGYTSVQGEPLNERKHWLHDDYVKFFRLAQWHMDRAGAGVVALVSNRNFLENTTFRGMRASLRDSFPTIEIIDLHGDAIASAREQGDENIFAIKNGVALSVLAMSVATDRSINYISLRGSRRDKLDRLASDTLPRSERLTPGAPQFRLSPERQPRQANYQQWFSLRDIMPYSGSAPVTARDAFVVAPTREELLARLQDFCDQSVSDDQLRERYFGRTRSTRYPPGDTRGWKLSVARAELRTVGSLASVLRTVQYRPLDWRWIAWHPALIDWPRTALVSQMDVPGNITLISRRQSPSHAPANFFWATRELTLDGILRSDNRGNETLFPLWLHGEGDQAKPNFSDAWLERCQRATGLGFHSQTRETNHELSAWNVLGYLYHHCFSLAYREQHQRELTADFPRFPAPSDEQDFRTKSERGCALLSLHTSRGSETELGETLGVVGASDPRSESDRVFIGAAASVVCSPEAWQFSIGAHQVCRKYWRDRRGQSFYQRDLEHYRRIVAIAEQTAHALRSS